MIEQELKNIWQASAKSRQINIETQQVVDVFQVRMQKLQKQIRQRDTREISASVFGILIFSLFAASIPFPITQFSCILSIFWFAYVIYRFWQSKKQSKDETLSVSLRAQLKQKKRLLKQQVKFLESAAYWYAGPSFLTNALFIIGLGNPTDYQWENPIAEQLLPLSINAKIGSILGLFLFYSFIVWLNKKGAKKGIKPILENIETIEQDLELQS